jgi:hypothetical protein
MPTKSSRRKFFLRENYERRIEGIIPGEGGRDDLLVVLARDAQR